MPTLCVDGNCVHSCLPINVAGCRIVSRLTSSSPSTDEDSFCKTAMSRREDIVSCIDVTMMDRSARSALPSPYSKIFPAFWAGAAFTHAAGLGGKRFIDFRKPHACVSAFVQQHGSKRAPARIEHRLGLSGLGKRGGIYVANEESPVGLDQAGAQFVQEIFAPIRDLGVNRAGSVSMAGALRASEDRFQVAVKAFGLDRRQSPITERCKSLQPKIDSETRDRAIEDRLGGKPLSVFVLHPQAQDPNGGNSRAGHPYSISKTHALTPRQTSRNEGRGRHTAPRVSLSLVGLKASVS